MRNDSEFYNVDWINGVVEVTIEVLVNGNYKDKKVRFNLDRNKHPWEFEGFVEGTKIKVQVPDNAFFNESINSIVLPEAVSSLSEKRIINAMEDFLDRALN